MFNSTDGDIKESCVQLTKQRDLIFKEIQKLEKSHKMYVTYKNKINMKQKKYII